jgi:alkanesulfonate monooxygenase SsuD/methylene tetrahydromethanopterin reductase-like flavin-dependent oxidoreductase (luciferase family)
LLEVWQRCDDIEVFESGWTFDHFYPLFGDSTEECYEGWITLTALLQATTRMRGGVLVTGMLYRHPAVLANMASTLDITSRGRLELGVGAGWNEEECTAYGIDLGSMADRFDRFEEGMEVLRLLLTQERSDFDGRFYRLENAMNNPKGPQNPLPICVGGSGLRRTIPAAAKYAHHWNYGSPTMNVDDFQMRNAVFLEALAAEGRDRSEMTVSTIVRYAGDLDAMVREAEAFAEAGIDLGIVSIPKSDDPAVVEAIATALAPLT